MFHLWNKSSKSPNIDPALIKFHRRIWFDSIWIMAVFLHGPIFFFGGGGASGEASKHSGNEFLYPVSIRMEACFHH